MRLRLVVVAAASACGSSGGTTTVTESQAGGGNAGSSKVLVGAGSTFVAPLVQQWEADYVKSPAAVTITYGAIGSGGGVDQITARTVDFGASDAPLSSDQAAACKGCIQIPWSLGAVAITYNVKGLQNKIHLTGPVIADMFMGKITSWNDPEIAKLNPGVSLPDTHITPVYRSDGSGTSFAFTRLADEGQPGLGEQRRHLDAAALPDRHGCRALERCRGGRPGDRRRRDVRRPGVRPGERSPVRAASERRRQLSGAGHPSR